MMGISRRQEILDAWDRASAIKIHLKIKEGYSHKRWAEVALIEFLTALEAHDNPCLIEFLDEQGNGIPIRSEKGETE